MSTLMDILTLLMFASWSATVAAICFWMVVVAVKLLVNEIFN